MAARLIHRNKDPDAWLAARRSARDRVREGWAGQYWGRSKKGNPFTKAAGVLITIFPAKDGYRLVIDDVFGKQTYPDVATAKRAALDGFLYVHEKED